MSGNFSCARAQPKQTRNSNPEKEENNFMLSFKRLAKRKKNINKQTNLLLYSKKKNLPVHSEKFRYQHTEKIAGYSRPRLLFLGVVGGFNEGKEAYPG